jgi:hypothetical protein
MAYENKFYQDPALHAKFERETVPCYGCVFLKTILDKRYCDRGRKADRKCDHYKESK